MFSTRCAPARVVGADSKRSFSQSRMLCWKRQTRSFLGARGRQACDTPRRAVVVVSARSTWNERNERATLSAESVIESDVRSRWSTLWNELDIDEAESAMMREGGASRAIESPGWRIMLLSDGSMTRHIKLATGPWTDAGYGALGGVNPTYETAVYFCYNKLAGIFCYTSFDGGATFALGGQAFGLVTTNGGLHGAISAAPDGTVYVPPRVATPTLVVSKDNGLNWEEKTMGTDVGTPNPRKNSEMAADADSNGFHVWTGADQGVYMSRSFDSGGSWEQTSLRISPVDIVSSVFPQIIAGDPGRIAVTYLGSEDEALLNTSDIDGSPWNGNAHYAPGNTTYHLYVTFSLNALDENPVFQTIRITEDPVQKGSICLNSGDCRDIGGSNRNLLDFNDIVIDQEGRIFIAYTDGCTGECTTMENPMAENSRDRLGTMAYLATGPSLLADVGDLTPLVEGNASA